MQAWNVTFKALSWENDVKWLYNLELEIFLSKQSLESIQQREGSRYK